MRRAFVGLKNIKSKWARETKTALLYPLRDLSLREINALGFDVGYDMWQTVKNRAITEPLSDGREGSSGRTRHPKSEEIKAKWFEASYPTSAGSRVFYGTKKRMATIIKEAIGGDVSIATIANYLPAGIKNAARPTDLCPVCEELKSLRLGTQCAPESTCTMGREAGPSALGDEKAEAIKVLEKHEKLAIATRGQCSEDMRNPPDDTVVAVCDWSGGVILRGHRSDAYEFFNASSVQLLGARVSFRNSKGDAEQVYVHAYGKVAPSPFSHLYQF